jgi:hypothetical protein
MCDRLVFLTRLALAVALAGVLAGCDLLGMESGTAVAARKEAEGKAVGSACRHALRAIEDCYTLNPKAQKAAVFAGWREMDEYMRENKIDGIVPVVPRKAAPSASASAEADAPAGEGGSAPATAQDAAPQQQPRPPTHGQPGKLKATH